tara:strand:- start:463 stop:660 length:198 start_codon:yes stop_codon:yes gene_type:complete
VKENKVAVFEIFLALFHTSLTTTSISSYFYHSVPLRFSLEITATMSASALDNLKVSIRVQDRHGI